MKNEKKVVFLRSTSIINDSRATKEINTLIKNGYDVLVLGWDRDGFAKKNENEDKGYKIDLFTKKAEYGAGIKNLISLFLFQIWLFIKLLVNSSKYSIIHSCDFDTAIPAKCIAKIKNKKLVYDIFDYYTHSHKVPKKLEKKIEKSEIKVINKADFTIICNEGRYKQIEKAKPKKVIVIHNTPSIPENFKELPSVIKQHNNKIKIVYVGILQGDRLLEEIASKIKEHPDIELHIGGFGRFSELFEELSKQCNNVFYYGKMKYADVLKLESECDILFATYNPEIRNHKFSAPNKIYEAMALKKPIIVCKNTGIDKIIDDKKLGISIEYSADDFIRAVKTLESTEEERNKIGQNGRKEYETNYSWEIMEERLLCAYSELN